MTDDQALILATELIRSWEKLRLAPIQFISMEQFVANFFQANCEIKNILA